MLNLCNLIILTLWIEPKKLENQRGYLKQFKSDWFLNKAKMAAICHLGFPKNWKFQNLAEFWVWTESRYQIWLGYLQRFKSYKLLNKAKMAAIRHLGFPINLKFQNMAEFWVCTESGYQIWLGYLKRFKSYRLLNKTKMAAILDFQKPENFKIWLNLGLYWVWIPNLAWLSQTVQKLQASE